MESGEARGKTGVRFIHPWVRNNPVSPTESPGVLFQGRQEEW